MSTEVDLTMTAIGYLQYTMNPEAFEPFFQALCVYLRQAAPQTLVVFSPSGEELLRVTTYVGGTWL